MHDEIIERVNHCDSPGDYCYGIALYAAMQVSL